MRDFIRILKRFVPPYKKYMVLNIVFNVLSAILNLFSFALIIPILQILFKMDEGNYTFMDWNFNAGSWESWKALPELIKNNFFWYVSDLIEVHGGSFALIMLGIFLIVATFLKVATMYLAFYTMIPIRTGVVRDIRNQINKKITQLPLSFFSEERKGDIIARVSGDVNEIETSIMSSLDMLFKNPILIVIYLVGMIAISWQLTVFVLILLPLAGYVMGQVGKKLKRKSLEGQQQWGFLMSQIEETLGGLRIIKAFNAEKKIQDRFERSNDTFRRLTNRIYRRQQMAHPMSEFLGTVTIAIVLWYGGTLILSANSPIDAPTFIYYLVIFYSIINPAKDLSKSVYAIQKGLASMERVDKILKAETDIHDPEHPKKIVLLDLGLPDLEGVEVIKKIRTWSNMPIIVISARSEDADKIEALDAGADDYITKPFSVEELLARIRVTQRRLAITQTGEQMEKSVFENGELKIDYAAGCTYLKEEELHLTPIEYKLLCLLSRNVGKVLTHTYITQQIWGRCSENDVASLRVFMATLRKKLEPEKNGIQYIQTHIGIGYRMLRIEKNKF